jgi:hypothetical protein
MKRSFLALAFLISIQFITAQTFTESNLPIIILNTDGATIPNEPKIPAIMKIIDNGPGQINHITDPGNVYDGNIGIELRGHYSASLPQKPYAIETRDGQQNELNVSLFGWPEESDWVLLANYNDKVFMRNVLAFKLSNEAGFYASRTKFVEVVLNGRYDGIYIFGEKLKRDSGRVDIAKLEPDEISGEPLTGGYIFKVDYFDGSNSWQSPYHPILHPEFDIHFVYYYPSPEDLAVQQRNYLKSYVTSFEEALYSTNFTDPQNGYQPFINSESFVNYFLVNELARNNDGFKKSYYFHKNRDGIDKRICAGPVWDFDWAWKNIDECSIFANTDGSGWAFLVNNCWPDVNSPDWQVRLLQDPAFVNLTRCRWEEMTLDIMNKDSLFKWIDDNTAYLWEAQERHYVRWPILGLNVGTPVIPPIPTTFQGEINAFKHWIELRLAWLDANIPGACDPTHITEKQAFKPIVFPNPVDERLYIDLPSAIQQYIVQLIALDGTQLDVPFDWNGASLSIDIKNTKPGIYLLRIADSHMERMYNYKILVEHK